MTEDAALKSLRATLRTYAGAGSTQWDEWAAAPDHHPMRRAILDGRATRAADLDALRARINANSEALAAHTLASDRTWPFPFSWLQLVNAESPCDGSLRVG